jgi:hypothetical protein
MMVKLTPGEDLGNGSLSQTRLRPMEDNRSQDLLCSDERRRNFGDNFHKTFYNSIIT